MIIKCPNCQTQYEVAAQAIGSAGRKVQCANCQQSWQAKAEEEQARPKPTLVQTEPEPRKISDPLSSTKYDNTSDRLFDEDEEAEMDVAFEDAAGEIANIVRRVTSAEHEGPAEGPEQDEEDDEGLNSSLQNKRSRALAARRKRVSNRFPVARAKRYFSAAMVILLIGLVVGGVFLRRDIVKTFPDLSGFYEGIGLPVNVVGLEFEDVETLRTFRDGVDVLLVSAQMRNIYDKSVSIPPILINILDANEKLIFQWEVKAQADLLEAGEVTLFETQLNSAPEEAARVQLVFSNGKANVSTN